VMTLFAGRGFVVVSPAPWGRQGQHAPLDFDGDREAALAHATQASVASADDDTRAIVAHFAAAATSVHACGFCYGGHLAFRAAFETAVRSTVCFYPTGLHANLLGSATATSLADAARIHGPLRLVWGRDDPHVPADGRARIHRALDDASVRFEARLFDAEHAFVRDVGPRFDPAAADEAIAMSLAFFRQ
jgi:carboxymethylenebutenolidase